MIHLVLAVVLKFAPDRGRGESTYQVRCSSCHGMALQGSVDGPPLVGKSALDVDFMLQTGRMPAAIPGVQPAQKAPQLSQTDIRAVVDYIVAQGHGASQLPLLASGDAGRGRAVFAENCAQCHGVTAHGASVGYANVAPSLMHTQPNQIVEAIRTGPGVMPRFGPDVLSDRDVDDLVGFIEFLQHRRAVYNPGGLQLANIGPVAEGFVAWVFGIGLLVLLVRRIGSTH